MSGTITIIDTPVTGNPGPNGTSAGDSGSAGQPETESASPFSNEDFTTLPNLTALYPEVTGGRGGAGLQGTGGANGMATYNYDANFDETVTYGPGGNGGPGGGGGAGGDGTLTMSDDTLGAVGGTFVSSFTLLAGATGGVGGIGAYGGAGGSAGDNEVSHGTNPNNGNPTTDTTTGAKGGAGGAGGGGGDGGTASNTLTGFASYVAYGTTLTLDATGGAGGTAYPGYNGAIGGETSAGGVGGKGGDGGEATATLSGSTVEDDYDVTIQLSAIGGNGGAGGSGGGGGVAETFSPGAEPSSTYTTANGASGGNGGAGGAAYATLTNDNITAPQVMITLYADEGAGGAGGTGGSGGTGVSTLSTQFNNGTPGAAGATGALGAGLITFTNDTITVGTYIAGATQHSTNNDLVVSLSVGSNGTYYALDGGAGGNLVFTGNDLVGTGTSQLELELQGGASNGGAIVNTANNTLIIDGSAANTMTGFNNFILDNGDTFIAGNGTYTVEFAPDPDTLVYTPTSGSVMLEGVTSSNLLLDFSGFGSSLTLADIQGDTTTSNGNTFITIPGQGSIELVGYTGAIPTADISFDTVCYLRGTHILTASGEVPVEDLRPGDLVKTISGQHRPLRWVGFGRTLVTPRNRDRATPVVVRRHALGKCIPHRDLYITRGHSLYLDGVLIPVEELINHRSIAWAENVRLVEYYHLELDSHDVVIAEGAHAESYREDANSPLFHNAATRPETPPMPPYAPVLHDHPIVKQIWRRLSDRCGAPNLTLTDDADLHLLADGVRLEPWAVKPPFWRFRLPGPVTDLRIGSRNAIPSMIGIDQDQRRLGVAVRRIVLAQSGRRRRVVDWDDACLTDGFHGAEPAGRQRWTTGEAVLPPSLLADVREGAIVELHVCGQLPYPAAATGEDRAAA